jgi:rod shape-determining protein MreD
MILLTAILSVLVAAGAQARLPALSWLGGLRLELLPALVAYGALTLRRSRVAAVALVAGAMQDALSAAPFGISALAYAFAAGILIGTRDALDRDLPWVQMAAGALASGACSVAACAVIGFTFSALAKLVVLALLSSLLTPVLFFAADHVRARWKWA